jgi:large subunit ribosomal protein L13
MKSPNITIPKTVERIWIEVDASSQSMGRVATQVANLLRGKLKRNFTPHMDMGDFVVAVNVDNLKFTGRKVEQKKYYHHSGYLGGLHVKKMKDELQKHPEVVFQKAVFNMLDDLKFRKKLMSRLKLVKGTAHSYKIDKKV